MVIYPITTHERKMRTVTATGDILIDDDVVLVNAAGPITLTFRAANVGANPVTLKNKSGYTVTLNADSSHTVNGLASETLNATNENYDFYPDNVSNWEMFN